MAAHALDKQYTVLLICDFTRGLTFRIMDVYRFFVNPPNIVLVRRRERVPIDPRLSVQVQMIPVPVVGFERASLANALSALPWVLIYLFYAFTTYLEIKRMGNRIRLVHAHMILPQGLFGLVLASLFRVPLVVTAAGQDVNVVMKKSTVGRALSLFVLKRARLTIAVSKPLMRFLQKCGTPRSVYVPNSVDTSAIKPVANSAKWDSILFVGSLIPRKRPLLLLQAFERVLKRVPTATLVVCGEGEQKEALVAEIAERGIEDRVTFVSNVSEETLNEIRSHNAVFVLPSVAEGLSLALLEAMAAGQIVVASKIESHESILEDGKNGLLFEVDNPADLAEQILFSITERGLSSEISRAAKQLSETEFSNAVVAKRLEAIYMGLLTDTRTRAGTTRSKVTRLRSQIVSGR